MPRHTVPTPVLTIVYQSAPEKPKLRRVGRKKLTLAAIELRDQRETERRARRDNERLAEREKRADSRQLLADRHKAKQLARKQEREDKERRQAENNKRSLITIDVKPAPAPVIIAGPLPSGALQTVGSPAIRGETAVRINDKTVIHVKHGKDIPTAIANWKARKQFYLACRFLTPKLSLNST